LPFFELTFQSMVYYFVKRLVDVFGAAFGLIVFSPLLLLISFLIKLSSDGPVFVENSNRVGKGGKVFRMWKFRTMVKNSHELIRTDPKYKDLLQEYKKNSFKLDNDPRVTPLGRLLRRTSLDEIPQFLNVLFSEMSLIGPRAYYPDELEEQSKKHPQLKEFIDTALKVKPGMTGLWQVSGRSDVGFERRIQMDASYAKNRSVLVDLSILFRTPVAVFKGEGTEPK
jgi:lipopolysaccharide/colanic/teichoic acid biosynthesis glycosyltransferase